MVISNLRVILFVVALSMLDVSPAASQSLEAETRSPAGTNSLHDDSDRLRGDDGGGGTNSLDNDSMNLRGRSPDQDGTNSLDDGSMDGDNGPDPD